MIFLGFLPAIAGGVGLLTGAFAGLSIAMGPITLVILGIAAAVAAVVFPVIRMAQDPKSAKGALIGIVALVAVFGLSYVLADSEVIPSFEKYISDEGTSKIIGASIISFYVLALGAIGAAIYAEISSMLK